MNGAGFQYTHLKVFKYQHIESLLGKREYYFIEIDDVEQLMLDDRDRFITKTQKILLLRSTTVTTSCLTLTKN